MYYSYILKITQGCVKIEPQKSFNLVLTTFDSQ